MTTKNPETHQNPELGKETNGNKKPETSLEKKREGEILRSLGIKKIKIEEAKSRIQELMKLNGQESKLNTNLDIHKSIMEAYAEINAVEQEISTELRDYTNSLNDEQKSQFAEVMFRSGYENFIMNNLDCFGESFKKQLGENLSISSMAKAYLDLLKEKNKTEISEDELKTFVELLKFK